MNLAFSSVLMIGAATFILTLFRDIEISMIFNLDAFLIVIGGTAIALVVGFPARRIRSAARNVMNAFSHERDKDVLIKDIMSIARMHKRMNIKDIETWMKGINDDFLKFGITLLINNYGARDIKAIMQREIMLRMTEYNFSQNLLKTVARLTPAFGLAGTVISLIKMFNHFESVDVVSSNLAVALMSTLYGVIIANLLMLPLSAKIKEKAIATESLMLITIDGILSISNKEHPLIIEEKLKGYQETESLFGPALGKTEIAPDQAGALS